MSTIAFTSQCNFLISASISNCVKIQLDMFLELLIIASFVIYNDASSFTRIPGYRYSILTETRDVNPRISQITQRIKPDIESRENRTFELFGALSHSSWLDLRHTEQQGLYFWIKVRYDDGIMHVKAKERLKFIGETTVNEGSLVEYHTGKTLEELLPYFLNWSFNFFRHVLS